MRRLAVFSLLLCLAALPLLAAADDEHADIRALLDRYAAAWGSLDPGKAAPLYATDADLVFYDVLPLKYTGWSEYDKGVRAHLAEFQSMKLTPKGDLKVTRHGNTAWTTQTVHIDVKPKEGEALSMDLRQTLVLEKRSGEWKIVHEHLSAPLEIPHHD